MEKIINLHRLNMPNGIAMAKYLLKRLLRMTTHRREKIINEYYYHLIQRNGILKEESDKSFTAFYPDLNMTIRTRKRPSSDLDVFSQIFRYLEYKPVVEEFKSNFGSASGINIIDAGSNIGLTAVYMSSFFNGANFICIEPDDNNFENLNYNITVNSIPNVKTIKAGIWSKDTNLKIISDFRDKNDWSFRVEETTSDNGLKAYSIPTIMKQYGISSIDILKIDVEGSEKEIFTNPESDTSFLAATKCIAIEIHDEFNCREEIYAVLRKYGFTFFNSGELTIGINTNLK